MFWSDEAPRGGAIARESFPWFEQPELWADVPARAPEAAPAPARVARAASRVRRPARAAMHRLVRVAPATPMVLARGRATARPGIARLMQVNDVVYGELEPAGDFDLPTRRFKAGFQLWKGKEIGHPFITGC